MLSLRKIGTAALDILFPPVCLNCKKTVPDGLLLCLACKAALVIFDFLQCAVCGARAPVYAGLPDIKNLCHTGVPPILAAATHYEDPIVKNLIWQLKYDHRTSAAKVLANLLFTHLATAGFDFSTYILVPIPLHASRKRERGYNQSELIAKELSKLLAIPLCADVLIKIRKTKPQAEIKKAEARRSNLKHCFKIPRPEKIVGKNILLVDDVSTSGTTLSEAATVLKIAGANQIIGLVVARAR